MINASFDVLAVGDACLDVILTGLDADFLQSNLVHASGVQVLPGGGYTTPIAMQRLGLNVTWATDFGSDVISSYVYENAKLEGVDLRFSSIHPKEIKRISVSLSDNQNRSFFSFMDINHSLPAGLKGLLFAKAKVVYMPGTLFGSVFDFGVRIAKFRKMKVVVDGNGAEKYSLKQRNVKRALKNIDIFLVNDEEACQLSGETEIHDAFDRLSQYCSCVIIKNGKNGALYGENGAHIAIPAIPVDAIDTTGAGDCFNAGYLAAWCRKNPKKQCIMWANIAAGLSTTVRGGAQMKVTQEMILSWISFYDKNTMDNG